MASRFWVGGTGTWDNADTTHWAATTGGAGGQSVPASTDTVTFDGSSGGGTVTVAATINGSNTLTSITMGAFTGTLTFATNNPNITLTTFSNNGSGTRTLNMGNGTWTITSAGPSTPWDTLVTNLTFNANSSTLIFSASASGNRTMVAGAGLTYNIVTLGADINGYIFTFNGSFTITTLNISSPSRVATSATVTVTNAVTWAGTAFNDVLWFSGCNFVLTTGSTVTWGVFRAVAITGSTLTATNSIDAKQNTGVTITAPSGGGVVGVIGS